MKAQLLHLSGPLRGHTATYGKPCVAIGSAADSDVVLRGGAPVAARHAEILFFPNRCAFHLRRRDGSVFVNDREIEEVILANDDVIEIGSGGPMMRFRIHAAPGSVCKPVRQMLADARDVGTRSGMRGFTTTLMRDLFTHASWRLKVVVPLTVLALVLVVSWFAGQLAGSGPYDAVERSLAEQRERYAADLARVRDVLEEYRRRQDAMVTKVEVDAVRADFARRAEVIDRMIAANQALGRVLEVHSRSVCLVHGSIGFREPDERGGGFLTDLSNQRIGLEYEGSGFLASREGHIITNHHVAEPWWQNPKAEGVIKLGYKPTFLLLEVCFPAHRPIPLDPSKTRLRKDDVDVAIVQADAAAVATIAPLPLATESPKSLRGQRVVVLGYPTGVKAQLARAESAVTRELLDKSNDLSDIIRGLAERDALAPVATQGALNDVLERRLVYDAGTTSGGSGGPVFGTDGIVIGVNFAGVAEFAGSNFGVPIRFARELLDPAPDSRPK